MLSKAFAKLTGRSAPLPAPAPGSGHGTAAPPSFGVVKLVNSSGRVALPLLQRMAATVGREDFSRFMQRPVLAGSGVHLGSLAASAATAPRELNRTVLFEPLEDNQDGVSASESLRHAVYPLVKGEFAATAGTVFSIGRTDTNDFVIPDYAISKRHALIEVRGDEYLLKDCGSTNGTTLNGERVEGKPVKLRDGARVSFARYEFSFLSPGALYGMLQQG
jgi:hypothetical protein